ncbi:MAG: AsmA family protein [Dongiaceae bacterium]
MDDLLTAFQAEISQELDACAADFDRWRRSPADTAAIARLHKVLCSIREMSVVLGQSHLSELASRGVSALESARSGALGVAERAVPVVAESLEQLRSAVRYLARTGDAAAPAPIAPRHGESEAVAIRPSASGSVATLPRPRATRKRRWYRPRNLLLASGASIAAAGVAAAIVLLSADPDDYRSVFEETIRTATGRQVTIGGIDLALSLSPTVVLEDVVFANAAWGSRPYMAQAERLEVEMALLPLLRGEFTAKRFILHGADILLEVDETGNSNWTLESGGGAQTGAAELPQLGRLTIEDSTLFYRNGATGETETLELRRVTAQQTGHGPLLDIDVETVINGQPVRFAGTVGAPQLLEAPTPYPLDITGEVAGLAITLKGEIAQPLLGRGYSLALSASGPSLADVGSMLALELPPGGPLRLTAIVDDAAGAVRIHDIDARIGQSEMSGEVSLQPGARWRMVADLAATHVDLQDFAAAEVDAGSSSGDSRLFSADPLPYRWIGLIDATATLAADRIVDGETVLTDVALRGSIEAGRLALDDLRFGYGGGEVALTATGDATVEEPIWALQGSARGLTGGQALRELFGLELISGGRADVDVNLAAIGGSMRGIAETLGGNIGANVANSRIDDDLLKLFLTDLRRAVSLAEGGAELRCLTAVFAFESGLGRSRTFVADTGAAVVAGGGSIDLRNETINMMFKPAAKDVSLAALAVPVHVTGRLADPSIIPDPVRGTANMAGSAADMATGGLAGAVLGLVGADSVLDRGPIASCAPLPAASAPPSTPTTKAATTAASPPPAPAQPAATQSATAKKNDTRSTTDRILDEASAAVDNIGTQLGDVFDGMSSSTGASRKSQQGSKSNR